MSEVASSLARLVGGLGLIVSVVQGIIVLEKYPLLLKAVCNGNTPGRKG